MRFYLKRVIPVLFYAEKADWAALTGQLGAFIKEMPPEEEDFSGALILTDSIEGCALAEKAGLPCAGLEKAGGETGGRETLPCDYIVTDVSAATPEYLEGVYRRFYDLPWEILESRRYIVREGAEKDVEALLNIYADIEEFSMTRPFETAEEGRRYMRDYREMVYRLYGYGLWVIEEKESGALTGVAGLERQIFQGEEYLALGYVIGRKWRGRGCAEEVCRAIMAYAEETFDIEELHCFAEPENAISCRLAEKLGFRREGTVRRRLGENGGSETELRHYIWRRRET